MAANDRVLWLGVGAALLVCGGAGYYAWRQGAFDSAPLATPKAAHPAPQAPPPVQHPLPPGTDATAPPLPPVGESDAFVRQALGEVFGQPTVAQSFAQANLVRRIVASVDNLARAKVAVEMRPVAGAAGHFVVSGPEDHPQLDERNFERYAAAVAAVKAFDMNRLVAVYLRLYPLLQQAYEDLGYPSAYFNDRLVAVIDDLLATPEVAGPIELTQPGVFYRFADPALEARSAGQKLLLRMGPGNAATIKGRLRELRKAVTSPAAPP